MKKKIKFPLLILVCLLLTVQTVFADSVELSEQPLISGEQKAQEKSAVTETTAAAVTESAQFEQYAQSTQSAAQSVQSTESAGPGAVSQTGQEGNTSGSAAGTDAQKSTVEVPEISSEAGVLYDATAKKVLFAKNPDKQLYPASITKVMTVLLAAEKLSPSDVITFKASATENLESGYTNVGIVTGDTMTAKDAMYAVLLKSACEVSNGIAEKVSGTQTKFAELMNARAKELGCKNTSFKNASGLNDSGHLTTAYDMALITAAAFSNATFRTVASTRTYTLPASKKRGQLKLTNSNKMLYENNAEYVKGIVGGKTGYTSKAGNTLVECAEIAGHQLVTVVMKSSGKQYTDTKKLFEYGEKLLTQDSAGTTTAGTTTTATTTAGTAVTGTAASGTAAVTEQTAAAAENTAAGKAQETETAKTAGWEETSAGRKYKKSDGTYAAGEWLKLDGEEYYFGSDGLAARGWKQFKNGAWYFFDQTTGAMVHKKWVSTDGKKYYYLKENGEMAVNTVIDGIYRVDENGVYVEKIG